MKNLSGYEFRKKGAKRKNALRATVARNMVRCVRKNA